jgi:hypothetical protein
MCYIWAEGNDSAYSFMAADVWEFDLCNWGSVWACCCSLFCVEVCREGLLSMWEWIDIALNFHEECEVEHGALGKTYHSGKRRCITPLLGLHLVLVLVRDNLL